jgi:hypothetical protein
MMRLAILLLLGTSVLAQQPAKKAAVAALPKGKTKVFQAIVMKVVGVAQARAKRGEKWKTLKVNDVLRPGVAVRTGRKSMVALRVGANATLLIDRQTRIAIPEIIQNGEKLKTRVSLQWGRTEIKVNKVGRINDFEVATPSATLAVRGTAFRVMWDVVNGHRVQGVPGNRIHSIHVEYLRLIKVLMSKADGSTEKNPLPALAGWYETFIEPLDGAFTPEELENDRLRPIDISRPHDESGLRAANQQRGGKSATREQ